MKWKVYIAITEGKTIIGTVDELKEIFHTTDYTIRNRCSDGKAIKLDGKRYYIDILFE